MGNFLCNLRPVSRRQKKRINEMTAYEIEELLDKKKKERELPWNNPGHSCLARHAIRVAGVMRGRAWEEDVRVKTSFANVPFRLNVDVGSDDYQLRVIAWSFIVSKHIGLSTRTRLCLLCRAIRFRNVGLYGAKMTRWRYGAPCHWVARVQHYLFRDAGSCVVSFSFLLILALLY